MEGFFIMVFVIGVFIALAVKASSARKAQANAAWAAAARALGLRYQDPPFGGARRMEGTLPTGQVIVETFTRSSGKSSTTYTRYRARYLQPLGIGLRLTREGFFSGVGKLLGADDIEVGDTAFDSQVIVKGDDPRRVIEFLGPSRRSRILRAMSTYPGIVVADVEVAWESVGLHTDPSRIAGTIRQLSQLARYLGSNEESATPEPPAGPSTARPEPAARPNSRTSAPGAPPVGRPVPIPPDRPEDRPEAAIVEAAAAALASARSRPAGPSPPSRDARSRSESKPPGALVPGPAGRATSFVDARRAAAAFFSGRVESAAAGLSGVSPASVPSPGPAPQPPPADTARPAGGEAAASPIALDATAVCEDIFRPEHTGLEVERMFEERYAGGSVHWRGILEGADEFSYDFVFGSKPGTKAVVRIHEAASGLYGAQAVHAVVRLPPRQTALRSLVGKPVRIEGRLVRVDSFLRQLFVAEGSIHEVSG